MELGVCTAATIEAELDTPNAGGSHRAITEHILGLADGARDGAALIDAADGTVTTWAQFASTVRAAAHGLTRRGLQDDDTVGVFVADAASHALAVHAVRAAGATAWPIRPATRSADIAAQLNACRARLLITSAALAELAIEATERSWARQIFAFGEAAATTPFSALLDGAEHAGARENGGADQGPRTPSPGPASDLAGLTLAGGPRLTRWDVVVAGPPCGEPGAYTLLLDLALIAGATIVAAPAERLTAAIGAYHGTAAIAPHGTVVEGIPAERVFSVG
ncbi:MAG TPA: AMP-binding protein [Streptosporangiaceae bacterium]|nr:AMP-binding protein [Streptosporangiaceae bacterium]